MPNLNSSCIELKIGLAYDNLSSKRFGLNFLLLRVVTIKHGSKLDRKQLTYEVFLED